MILQDLCDPDTLPFSRWRRSLQITTHFHRGSINHQFAQHLELPSSPLSVRAPRCWVGFEIKAGCRVSGWPAHAERSRFILFVQDLTCLPQISAPIVRAPQRFLLHDVERLNNADVSGTGQRCNDLPALLDR